MNDDCHCVGNLKLASVVKCDAADRPCVLVARPRESMFTSSASQTAELDQDIVAVLTGSQSPSHTRRVQAAPIFGQTVRITSSCLKF